MSDELVRHTDFYPAWGSVPPDDEKGIHSVTLRFAVSGPKGAVHFSLYTGWHLPEVHKHLEKKLQAEIYKNPHGSASRILTKPIPVDIGYHSPVPVEGAGDAQECDLVPGGKCYGSGNMLRARKVYEVLTRDGSDGIWKILEGEYKVLFGEGGTDEMDVEEVPEETVQDEG